MPDNSSSCTGKHANLIKSVVIGVLVGLAILGYHLYEYFKGDHREEGAATDHEILELSKKLFEEDQQYNSFLESVNFQGRTRPGKRDDRAPQSLINLNYENLGSDTTSTVALLRRLYDNYELDSQTVESVTNEEKNEQLDFLNAVLKTPTMKRTMKFLHQKGVVESNHDAQLNLLMELWFLPYSRGRGLIGSSGFEHVFMAEIKDQNILGFHNWIYFAEQERLGQLDYKGYIDRLDLGKNDISFLATRFTFHGIVKPYNSLLIGTSPELEMSLYTVCFLLRSETDCEVQSSDKKFNIVTHQWDWKGKKTIATAYPALL